ncbi:aminodeoxychorismate synthase [Cladophialophora carrionii CBS 160.54]|uniref:aminodeoxychorismate synthase n=1 Tax=Cladophialophora carrionii CBS 160.54 TaxID=1279043 RepID=V9DCE6_9EURO|nr:aminodeoxychorismate synthase [Cladophialophora carrionii CBS 160.54]ETI23647.1 aminodeoxychorismate synthase [Cladophialophora carrionii CBS 160.54]
MTTQGSILFVDAYDSFAENIAALLHGCLQVQVTVIRIDCNIQQKFKQTSQDFFASFDAIVLGPGPGNPENGEDVGLFNQVWAYAENQQIPVLGICLGFQSLCARYSLPVMRMSLPCHGHAKEICHSGRDIFSGTEDILATCYNSLGVYLTAFRGVDTASRPGSSGSNESMSSSQSLHSISSFSLGPANYTGRSDVHQQVKSLEVLAWDKNGWVMAVKHRLLPFHGFQFHPESCKSNLACQTLVKQWWKATTSHNEQRRGPFCRRQARPIQVEGPDDTILPTSAVNLLRELLLISSTCKGSVHRKSMHLPGASSMIADLCYQNSWPDSVAMLESTKRGRYSIYSFTHEQTFLLEYKAGQILFHMSSSAHGPYQRSLLSREVAVTLIESFIRSRSFKGDEADLPFSGGFIGFISYEFNSASLHLKLHRQNVPPPLTPEISLLWVDRSVIYDHDTGMAHVQSIRDDDLWVDEIADMLQSNYEALGEASSSATSKKAQEILSSAKFTLPNHDRYVSQIRACQSELLAGNSYELCLTTEATITTPTSSDAAYLLYRNIQRHNPVPFASYMSFNKTTILSSSPEQFLSWSAKDGTIDMIPMKGTVKKTPEMTRAKATEILSSAKESAENLMIADLIRHDLYSTVGHDAKVEVVKLCDVVESETVFSLVSHIRAHAPISPDVDKAFDEYARAMSNYGIRALTRTLPPGSMTGAPKKRSCEILDDLERRDRGVYSGAIGYIDVCGNGAWSVVIRSAFSNREDNETDPTTGEETQKWRVGAGGAITVLSNEEEEWEEMMTKLDSVLRGFRVD